jgi:hypothetical protein
MRAATSPPHGRSFTIALTFSLAREDLARFCGDVPNGLHYAHHSRILQPKREYVLPHALIIDRVPVQQPPLSPRTSCTAFIVSAARNNAGVLAQALHCHCLGHRSCRRELLRNGDGEEGCCERGRVGADAERIKEEKWDGRCVRDLERYERDDHRGGKRHGGHCRSGREGGGRGDGDTPRWVVTRVGDARAEFAGKSVDVNGDESYGRVWVRERRIVYSEDVGGKNGRRAIENGELVSFRETTSARRRGLGNVECVA